MRFLRSLLTVPYVGLVTALGSTLGLIFRIFDSPGDMVMDLGRWWSGWITWVAGVRLQVDIRAELHPEQPEVVQAVLVHEQGRGRPEGDDVGQRIQVAPQVGLGFGQPRHPAVKGVEEEAEAYGQRRQVEVGLAAVRGRQRQRCKSAQDA